MRHNEVSKNLKSRRLLPSRFACRLPPGGRLFLLTPLYHKSAEKTSSLPKFCVRKFSVKSITPNGKAVFFRINKEAKSFDITIRSAFKFGFIELFVVHLPRCSKGVQGAKPPHKRAPGGRCRRGERPLTRTGRCKKIVLSQKVFSNFLVTYVSCYSQCSCGFRRASGRSRPPPTPPAVHFFPKGDCVPLGPLLNACRLFYSFKQTDKQQFEFSPRFKKRHHSIMMPFQNTVQFSSTRTPSISNTRVNPWEKTSSNATLSALLTRRRRMCRV